MYAYWTSFANIMSHTDKPDLNAVLKHCLDELYTLQAGRLRYGIITLPGGGSDWVYDHFLRIATDKYTIPHLTAISAPAPWWSPFGDDEMDGRTVLHGSITDMFKTFKKFDNEIHSRHPTIVDTLHCDIKLAPLPKSRWTNPPPAATPPLLDVSTTLYGSTGSVVIHAAGGVVLLWSKNLPPCFVPSVRKRRWLHEVICRPQYVNLLPVSHASHLSA